MPTFYATFCIIARVIFHAAVALAIVVVALDVFAPHTLVAAHNAVSDTLRPLMTRLPQIEMDLLIQITAGLIATVWGPCRGVGRSLGSTGAALVHTVHQSSWTDLMEDAQTTGQWLKAQVSIATKIITAANDTSVGRLLLLVAMMSLINNMIALVRTVGLLARIATSIVLLIYKTIAYVVYLLTRIVTFFCRFLGNVVAFIHSLF